MSAFWKKTKDEKSEGTDKEKKSVSKKDASGGIDKKKAKKENSKVGKEKKKKNELVVPEEKAELIAKVLDRPMISEAVMIAQELGKYTFKVKKSATKKEIALAVAALYNVTVEKVNVVNYKPVRKFFRGKKGKTKGYKKAIVTLAKGEEIKLF